MSNSKIIGIGSYAPKKILTNFDLEKLVDTNDEWIVSRTGIKERHIAVSENTSDLATKAAIEALTDSNLRAEDIDYIIVATCTPDKFIPSTACMVQKNIGSKNAAAFDISAACTGFIYALQVANSLIKGDNAKNILVIGADVFSKILDWEDRSTCVLFGDGAGAAILSKSNENGLLCSKVHSDGAQWEGFIVDALDIRNPFVKKEENNNYVYMNGGEIFKFAVKAFESSAKEIMDISKTNMEEIDYVIPHQANYRIIETISRRLKIPMNKFITNLDEFGNTSAASVPMALYSAVKSGKIKKGNKVLLVAFGGGLTWGGTLIEWCL